MEPMDEISQGPERDPRLSQKTRRWLTAVAVAGLVAVAATVMLTRAGARQGAAAPRASATTATPAEPVAQPTAFPGPRTTHMPDLRIVGLPGSQVVFAASSQVVMTQAGQPAVVGPVTMLTCQPATRGRPGPNWRAGSLHVGPLWLVAGRQQGYVRLGGGVVPGGAAPGHLTAVVPMLIYADAGSGALLHLAPGSRPYFQFVDGAGQPLAGDTVILGPCQDGNGLYHLGFRIAAGHSASVEAWTVPSARPVWLTFTAPARPAKPGS